MRPARTSLAPRRVMLRSRRKRARRAARPAIEPRTKAAGTATSVASSSVTSGRRHATATPAGIAAIASVPKTIATRPPLLLDIGPAVGRRRRRAADHARDGDEGEHVGERGEQRRDGQRVLLQVHAERAREPEQEARRGGAERAPVPEDERGERD